MKKTLLLFFAIGLFLYNHIGSAQTIATDAYSTAEASSVTSYTWTHTVGSGSARALVVTLSSSTVPTSITYNSVSLTKQVSRQTSPSHYASIWVLAAPSSGANVIQVDFSSSSSATGGGQSFTGVSESTPVIATHTASASYNASTTNGTLSITSASGEYGIAALANFTSTTNPTISSGTSHYIDNSYGVAFQRGAAAYLSSSGSTVTLAWTISGSSQAAVVGISLNPGWALPIELSDFNLACTNHQVQLNWTTQSETNNDYFTIERSSDALSFYAVAKVKGAGNSISPKYYTTTDELVSSAECYYRLKQTDFDGKYEYSKILHAGCDVKYLEVYIYPNPVNNVLVYSIFSDKERELRLEIVNDMGQVIYMESISVGTGYTAYSKDISSYAKGMYLLRVNSEKHADLEKFQKIVFGE